MARSRFPRMAIFAVALAATQLQAGWSDDPQPQAPMKPAARSDATCVVYALGELGSDPSLGAWIAKTIPTLIQPGTWDQAGGQGRLTYHAPSQVMAIAHTTAVHAQVDAFLKDLKKARATAAAKPQVVPAHYTEPVAVKLSAPAKASSYPVPAPLEQPKHLFHLIIRYEGDGIVDSTIAGLVKDLAGSNAPKEEPGKKPAPESANASSLKQLLHFIVRYEGDGIIDANVASLLKAIYSDGGSKSYPAAPFIIPPAGAPLQKTTPYGSGPATYSGASTFAPPPSASSPSNTPPSKASPSNTPPTAEPVPQNP